MISSARLCLSPNLLRLPSLLLAVFLPALLASSLSMASDAYKPCAACHGQKGEGNAALHAPALAGQQASYLARQLKHFKAGIRGSHADDTYGAQMRTMAVGLSDDAIAQLAELIAAMPALPVVKSLSGDLKNGNNYYQANCGACHGGQGEGNAALNSPALNILGADYMQRQYRNFQAGVRGSHPDDRYGRQMKMMSNSLPSEQHLIDVLTYIQSLANAQ